MKRVMLLAPIAMLGGCKAMTAPEITDCEDTIVRKLKAPSTYKRIEARSTFMETQSPPEVWVSIEYDAANSFGTPIRDSEICKYPAKDGRADMARVNQERSDEVDKIIAQYQGGANPASDAADAVAEAMAEASRAAMDAATAAPARPQALDVQEPEGFQDPGA